ncbi:MAG: TIGR03086 family metal-binding protein [Acidimicrobiales bacterium]
MSQNLRTYTKTLYAMDAVVRRVPADAWDNPSPCDDWTAREALGHTIWGLKRMTAGINGDDPPAEQAEADVAGDDPVGSWTAAMDAMLAALDHKDVLAAITPTPFGEMPVDQALGSLFIDPLTHTFDVAKATGVDHALPTELAEQALAVMTPLSDILRSPGLFGEVIDLRNDASVVDTFIAFTGRQP